RIFQLYTDLLISFSEKVPLILIVDDLHWVDSASAQLLFHLSRRITGSRILLLGAYRPNDVQLGRGGERHPMAPIINELKRVHGDITMTLGDEAEAERREFVDALIDASPNHLDDQFRAAFFRHTGGYPLFSQELLHGMKASGALALDDSDHWVVAEDIDWDGIPPRVEGVIEERIERLDDDLKELLLVASVQGENFIAGIAAALVEESDRKVLRTLTRELGQRHGLVREVSSTRINGKQVTTFRFSHNLFRHFLYNELGAGERMSLHAEVAELMAALHEGRDIEVASQLAYHFAMAEDWDRALPHYLAAAKRFQMVGAYDDALEYLQIALGNVDHIAAENKDAMALETLVTIGGIHQALKGYTHPDVEQTFSRACELTDPSLDPVQRAAALYGLWTLKLFNLELDEADQLARAIERIGDASDNDLVRVIAYRSLANGQYQLGELDDTIRYANQVFEHYDPEQAPEYLHQLTYDPKVFSLGLRAWSESLAGEVDTARATELEMFAWADELDHPTSRCAAFLVALELSHNIGDYDRLGELAELMRTLAAKYRFPWYQAFAEMFLYWLEALSADGDAARTALDTMMRTYHDAVAPDGNLLVHSQYSRMLGEALLAQGDAKSAFDALEKGIRVSKQHNEGVYLRELAALRDQAAERLAPE
ncbi:MAG: hypothetical protein AAAFM81_12535, partial [Pseudomonadota bacterium]